MGASVALAVAFLAGGVLAPPTGTSASPTPEPSFTPTASSTARPRLEGIPRYDHVVTIVLENQSFDATFADNSPATYLKSLIPQGAFATQYFATSHVSLGNYLMLTSGQPVNPLTATDCEGVSLWLCVQPQQLFANGTNIADQLEAATPSLSWKGYMDGTSAPCVHAPYSPTDPRPDPYQGKGASPTNAGAGQDYADRHNPFVYYDDIVGTSAATQARCLAHVRPYAELAADLSGDTLPAYAFITPDTCNDGHDDPCAPPRSMTGGLRAADEWLSLNVPPVLDYMNAHNGLLVITFDEGAVTDPSGCCHGGLDATRGLGGRVGLIALGPHVVSNSRVTTAYDHASLLRTVEDAEGIGTYLNDAGSSTAMTDLFQPTG